MPCLQTAHPQVLRGGDPSAAGPVLILLNPVFKHCFYLCIWLHQTFIAACGIFHCGTWYLCGTWAWKPHRMWDLSSLTWDGTHIPCFTGQILNHWTTKEVPLSCILVFDSLCIIRLPSLTTLCHVVFLHAILGYIQLSLPRASSNSLPIPRSHPQTHSPLDTTLPLPAPGPGGGLVLVSL